MARQLLLLALLLLVVLLLVQWRCACLAPPAGAAHVWHCHHHRSGERAAHIHLSRTLLLSLP
jgi:hypothetical protein